MNIEEKFFLIIFAALFFSLICLFINPFFTIGLLGLFLLTVFSFKNTKIIFYAIFLWSIFAGILTNLTILGKFRAISYVDEALVSILVLNIFLKPKQQKDIRGMSKLIIVISLFASVALFSAIINKSSYLALLGFLSTYLKFFIIFICALIFLEPKDMKRLIVFMLFLELLQFAVANIQFFTFGKENILVGSEITLREDAACGLFGLYGAHPLGHFSTIFFILSVSLYLFTVEKKWLFFIGICLYNFIISFTEHDYLFLVIFLFIVISVLLKEKIKAPFRFVLLFGAAVLIFLLIFLSFKANIGPVRRYAEYLENPQKIKGAGKIQSLLLVKDIALEEPVNAIVGVGPGGFSSGIAGKFGGEYYKKYIEFRVSGIESTLDYWWSNFSSLVSEIGISGYLLYMAGFLIIFLRLLKNYRYEIPVSGFYKGVAFASCNIMFFLMFLSFLSNALEWIAIMFPSAIISAYVWKAEK